MIWTLLQFRVDSATHINKNNTNAVKRIIVIVIAIIPILVIAIVVILVRYHTPRPQQLYGEDPLSWPQVNQTADNLLCIPSC